MKADVEQKTESGYYSPENKEARRVAKVAAVKQKAIDEVNADHDKTVKESNAERLAKLAVLKSGLSIDNFIYYTHTNEGCFNWNTSSFHKAVTAEQFEQFLIDVKECKLPENITFKLKG